jgi:eukaryotic-like serine/threonine-protein kinase
MADSSSQFELASLPSNRVRRHSPFFWFAIAVSVVVAFECGFTLCMGARQIQRAGDLGWNAGFGAHGAYVIYVEPDGPAAGRLQAADELIDVNGDSSARYYGPNLAMAGSPPGTRYRLTISRSGRLQTFTLPIAKYPAGESVQLISIAFTGVLLYVIGVCLGLLKPDDPTTRLGFAAFMTGALMFSSSVLSVVAVGLDRRWLLLGLAIRSTWMPFHFPIGYDFLSRFPHSVEESRFSRFVRVALYVAAFCVWFPGLVMLTAAIAGASSPADLLPGWLPVWALQRERVIAARFLEVVASVGMCLVLIRNYRALSDRDSRVRMRWAGLGLALSIFPYAALSVVRIVAAISGKRGTSTADIIPGFALISMLMVGAAPIAIAYSILKHRIMGIRVAVRRGVQYLLARNALRVIILLPVLSIMWQVIAHRDMSITEVMLRGSKLFNVFLAVSAAVSLRYRKQMMQWVDRKFFRTAYDQEQMLWDLTERVKRSDSIEAIATNLAIEIEMALHPSALYIFFRREQEGSLSGVYPSHSPDLSQLAAGISAPLDIETLDSAMNCFEFGEYLCVPMVRTDERSAGALVLGPKKSEEPYTKRDRDLLLGLGGQAAMMLEVLWLKGRVREEEQIRIDVLGRLDSTINLIKECPACGLVHDGNVSECERDQSRLTLTLPVERVLDGKYRLEERIGTGGMGAVFRASDLRLHRTVAVKIMIGGLFGNQTALRRFEREARAVARLEHRNIISIYDFGRIRGDGAYLVMQQVRGKSWRAELKTWGRIAPDRIASWMSQLCEGIAVAHDHHVIHRDLKPENVIVSHDEDGKDRIVVLDFGVAKLRREGATLDEEATNPGVVLGTYAYMSPEQRLGQNVDARTDIYSVGVMVLESLSGRHPPQTGASMEWLHSVVPADVPAYLEITGILARCIAEGPADRYSSIVELQKDLIPALSSVQWFNAGSGGGEDAKTVTFNE